jgi:hypothetical protein
MPTRVPERRGGQGQLIKRRYGEGGAYEAWKFVNLQVRFERASKQGRDGGFYKVVQ